MVRKYLWRFQIALLPLVAVTANADGDLSVIERALISGDEDAAIALFQSGLDVDGAVSNGSSFVVAAAHNSQTKLLSYLLSAGADPTQPDDESGTALLDVVRYGADPSLPILLATTRFDVNAGDKYGHQPLDYAATGSIESLVLLLCAGADPNLPTLGSYKIFPVQRAAERGFPENLQTLIEAGADASGEVGDSAIRYAAKYDTEAQAQAIVILAEAGADPNGDAVWDSMAYDRYVSLNALFEAGADVDQRGHNDVTPLIRAVSLDLDLKMVRIVLARRPNLELKARFPFLVRGISDIRSEERYADATALMLASAAGRLDFVRLLVEAGAKLETKNRRGDTALDFARRSKKSELVDYLEEQTRQ